MFCGKPFVNTAVIELTATAIQTDNKVLVGAKGNSVLSQRADPQCRSALRLWAATLLTQHVQELRHGERSVEDKHVPEMRGCMLTKGCVVACLQRGAWLHAYKGLRGCLLTKGCVVAWLQRGAWLLAYKGLRGCMVTKGCVVAWLQRVAWLHAYKGLRGSMVTKGCVVAWLQRGAWLHGYKGVRGCLAHNTSVIYLLLVEDL